MSKDTFSDVTASMSLQANSEVFDQTEQMCMLIVPSLSTYALKAHFYMACLLFYASF